MTDPAKLEAVAWRWRNRPDGVWNYQEDEQRISGVEQHSLTPLSVAQAEIDRLTGLADELSGLLATTQLCAEKIEARALAAEAKVERAEHLLRQRDRLAANSRRFWVRAGKAALAGDPRELRNRIDMAEAEPVPVVLSSLQDIQDA